MTNFAEAISAAYATEGDAVDLGRAVLLSEKGVPTPVVHTRMVAPASRMDPADDVAGAAKASPLWARYGERADSQSAREILAGRLEARGQGFAAQGRARHLRDVAPAHLKRRRHR